MAVQAHVEDCKNYRRCPGNVPPSTIIWVFLMVRQPIDGYYSESETEVLRGEIDEREKVVKIVLVSQILI